MSTHYLSQRDVQRAIKKYQVECIFTLSYSKLQLASDKIFLTLSRRQFLAQLSSNNLQEDSPFPLKRLPSSMLILANSAALQWLAILL